MIRLILAAALTLWLVAGCQAAPEDEIQPSSTRDVLAYCAEVMPEVRAFTHSMNEIERTGDEGYFDDMLAAARAIDDISTTARQGLRGVNPPEGEWLRELGPAVLSQFPPSTSPDEYPRGGVATTFSIIFRDLAESEPGPQAWKINKTMITSAVAKSAFRIKPLYLWVSQQLFHSRGVPPCDNHRRAG